MLALVALASCGTDREVEGRAAPPPPPTGAEADLPVQADTGTEMPIEGIDAFVAMADVIAIGTFTDLAASVTSDGPDPDDPSGSTTEYGALTLQVDDLVKGVAGVEAGTTVSVRVGSRILDGDGEPISTLAPYVAGLEGGGWEDLVDGAERLVFLTRVGSRDESWAISSSQGVLDVDDGVVSRLTQDEGPGAPDYTEVLDGVTVEEARAILAG